MTLNSTERHCESKQALCNFQCTSRKVKHENKLSALLCYRLTASFQMLIMKAWTEVRTWESDLGAFDVTGVDDERRHRHRVDLVLRVVLPESGP